MAELTAPIVPVPDTSALQYVAKGLAGMMANRRYQQQFELAQQKMIQDTALDQAKFELARTQVAQDFSLKQQQLGLTKQLTDARSAYYYAGAAAKKKGMLMMNDWNVQLAEQQGEAMADYEKKYHLNDGDFQAKNPIAYAKNARDWTDEWQNSPNVQIKRAIANLQGRVKPLVVTIPNGIKRNTIEGTIEGINGTTKVPVLDVIEKLQNPETQENMSELLEAAGYTKPISKEGETPGGVKVKQKGVEIQDPILGYLKMGKGLDFTRKSSRVPEMMAPSAATNKGVGDIRQQIQQTVFGSDQETEQDEQTYPDEASITPAKVPLQFAPTEQEKALNAARLALSHGAPLPAVALRLRDFGVDPGELFNDTSRLAPGIREMPSEQLA